MALQKPSFATETQISQEHFPQSYSNYKAYYSIFQLPTINKPTARQRR